jgi:hypothetical protein
MATLTSKIISACANKKCVMNNNKIQNTSIKTINDGNTHFKNHPRQRI